MATPTVTEPDAGAPGAGGATSPDDHRPNWFTRRRLAKWNGPQRPRDWRFVVGSVGKVLIATGLLLFGFVAYQLWGTGIETARAQRALADQFDELLATLDTAPPTTAPATTVPVTVPSDTVPSDTVPSESPAPVVQPLPPISEGDPIARIEIPEIGVSDIVVAGVGVSDLQKGPGHFPGTPLPGQLGNAAIAGHRTTYGQPFRNVDRLDPGDEIVVTTLAGRFVYRVTGTQIVSPSDYHVVATTRPDVAEITLVSCHPVWSTSQRIIISGVLDAEASDAPAPASSYTDADQGSGPDPLPGEEFPVDEPAVDEPAVDEPPVDEPAVDEPAVDEMAAPVTAPPPSESVTEPTVPTSVEDAFGRGWFHDDGALPQVALWGTVLALISIGAYLLSRRTKRDLVGFVVGVVPFCIAAFFFFQNVNRLLPPSL